MSASDPPAAPSSADAGPPDRVQCSNCCRLAPITGRRMGLLFYECELCLTTGAVPDPDAPPEGGSHQEDVNQSTSWLPPSGGRKAPE